MWYTVRVLHWWLRHKTNACSDIVQPSFLFCAGVCTPLLLLLLLLFLCTSPCFHSSNQLLLVVVVQLQSRSFQTNHSVFFFVAFFCFLFPFF